MTVTGREKAMAAITGMVILYGVLGLLAKGRIERWQSQRDEYRQTTQRIALERTLIAQRALWESRYAGMKDLMPVFPADQPVDTHWLAVMDKAATKNGLNIAKRQVGAEKLVGDVYEIAIECKEWDGTLDALVHFLYDLESAGVMLDVRQMFIRPSPADRSHLRGSFALFCAYMREKPGAAALRPPPAAKPVPAARPAPVSSLAAPRGTPRKK